MPAYPAATPNLDGVGEFGASKTVPNLSIKRMAGWVDLHIRAEQAVVADVDDVAI